jgi:hypothetical protein
MLVGDGQIGSDWCGPHRVRRADYTTIEPTPTVAQRFTGQVGLLSVKMTATRGS